MKAAAMSVWIFINLLCFGMCGYLYLIWSQYWMSIERQRLFSETQVNTQRRSSRLHFQESPDKFSLKQLFNSSIFNDAVGKTRRSAVLKNNHFQQSASSKSRVTSDRPSINIILKSHGRPRFPNIHKPILEFDSDKYECAYFGTPECDDQTREFKELLLKEFHRVLMSDSKVFTSGLDAQNTYDVKYERGSRKNTRKDILCALNKVPLITVTAEDKPFSSLDYPIPKSPLQENRFFNMCAVVTSAGALRNSRFGEFIDSHDMVLRFNNAPTENFTEDVGSKTTFRILNSQVVAKPEFKFLEDSLYKDVSMLIWDPANFTSNLEDWYHHPDFPLFSVYKKYLKEHPKADVHLLNPEVLWKLWTVLQDASPYRLRRNPPSSGFIGIWFALHRCNRVRVFEYIPSVRATRRCHYYLSNEDAACTLGAWHPLAQEKALAERIRDNPDVDVFQRGYIDIPGFRKVDCNA